jgi:DNA-directed RNA polymerase subunit RPC12/RpoP
MKLNEYQCAQCGGIFEKEWTDEEARAEMKENKFDAILEKDMCIVCDDCYKKIMGSIS